jgi:hypothetical protein
MHYYRLSSQGLHGILSRFGQNQLAQCPSEMWQVASDMWRLFGSQRLAYNATPLGSQQMKSNRLSG